MLLEQDLFDVGRGGRLYLHPLHKAEADKLLVLPFGLTVVRTALATWLKLTAWLLIRPRNPDPRAVCWVPGSIEGKPQCK